MPWSVNRNIERNLHALAEPAELICIAHRIEPDNQGEVARGNGGASREVEIDAITNLPAVDGVKGIEQRHRLGRDILQFDELVRHVVQSCGSYDDVRGVIMDFADHDWADQRLRISGAQSVGPLSYKMIFSGTRNIASEGYVLFCHSELVAVHVSGQVDAVTGEKVGTVAFGSKGKAGASGIEVTLGEDPIATSRNNSARWNDEFPRRIEVIAEKPATDIGLIFLGVVQFDGVRMGRTVTQQFVDKDPGTRRWWRINCSGRTSDGAARPPGGGQIPACRVCSGTCRDQRQS